MVLSNLESMQLVVSLSESEIGNVHVGQIATLTIEALNGQKLAGHVTHVAQTSTSTSGAASYDVTFKLDQGAVGLKVGMSATAEVVIKQAEGVNVPTSAIKGGSVTVLRAGKQVSEQVTTGLAGDSSTIILSGVQAGETVVLPTTATGTSSSGASSFGSRGKSAGGGLGSSLGGGGFPSGGPPSGGFSGGAP
jgi:HlyD family secretion protein